MKKLIIAVAVMAVAAVSQAASVAWGGAISQPDGATELAANTAAYLVYSTSAITGAAKFDGTDLMNGSDAVIASTVSTHTITGEEAGAWEFGELYDKPGASVDGFYAVLISDMGATPNYSIYTLAEVTGTTPTSSALNRQIAWSDGYLTQGGYTVAAAAVPEPTSGLLLLIGVAGLALRRKRA